MTLLTKLPNLLLATTVVFMLGACDTKTSQETNTTSTPSVPTQQTQTPQTQTTPSSTANTPNALQDNGGTNPTQNNPANANQTDTISGSASSGTADGTTATNGSDGNAATGTDSDATTGGNDDNTSNNSDDNATNDNNTTGGGDDNGTTGGNDDNGTAGGNDDNTTGGGTDTDTVTLQTLTLSTVDTTLNKDHNTTLTIEAKYSDGTTKPVTNNIEWIATPSDAVTIHGNTLTALKDVNAIVQAKYQNTLSNQVKLSIYWEVDGHRLPPEPDPVVNNATLLGIDSNNNGVRDDVERWIYEKYKDKHPIMIPLRMQAARAYQKIIVDPSKAYETHKYMVDAIRCEWVFTSLSANYFGRKPLVLIEPEDAIKEDKEMEYVLYNTTQRARAYGLYNQTLSGGVFRGDWPSDSWIEDCDFNTTKFIEMSEKL